MALSKLKDDSWAEGPLSVTSYLSFSNQHFQRYPDENYSPCCGMGWRFYVSWSSTVPGQRKIALRFDPHHLSIFPLQYLTLTVKCNQTLIGSPPRQLQITSLSNALLLVRLQKAVDAEIEMQISFLDNGPTTSLPPAPPSSLPPQVLDLITASVEGRDVIDVAFHLYRERSRRQHLWTCPRAVYGTTVLLKDKCFYLDALLFDNDFKDPSIFSLSQIPSSMEDYDYESDSDFDSDSVFDGEAEEAPQDIGDSVGLPSSGQRGPDPDTHLKSSEGTTLVDPTSTDQVATQPEVTENRGRDRSIRSIHLTTFAFRTWKAFILYLEVQRLAFKTLRSQRVDRLEEDRTACSPRSMYRLADMVGLEDLRKQAFSAIRSSITEQNIIEELFSSFTSLYPEVRSFEIAFLLDHPSSLNEFYGKLSESLFVEHQHVVAEVMKALGARAGQHLHYNL